MAKPLEKHVVEKVKGLILQKVPFPRIMEQTGVSRVTVYRYASALSKGEKTKTEINQNARQILIDKMANDRIHMRRFEVAKKYGMCDSNVGKLLANHPLSSKFLGIEVRRDKPIKKAPKPVVKKAKPKPTLKKKDVVKVGQIDMQKGHVKLQNNEKVFETKKQDFSRSVSMHDSKNTVLFIKSSDKRSNEQIRKEWLSKSEGELRKVS